MILARVHEHSARRSGAEAAVSRLQTIISRERPKELRTVLELPDTEAAAPG